MLVDKIKSVRRADMLAERANVRNILVIKLERFGDTLLLTPLLSTLLLNYPNASVDVVVYAGTEAILPKDGMINKIFKVDRNLKSLGIRRQYSGEFKLLKELNQTRYDCVINLTDRWRAGFYAYLLHPKFSVGFDYPKRNNMFWKMLHSELIDMGLYNERHTVMHNLSILEPLNVPKIITKVTMHYQKSDMEKVDGVCQQYNLKEYILIQPTAFWGFKMWPPGKFSELIGHLLEKGETVVITSGKNTDEMSIVDSIIAGCGSRYDQNRLVNLAGMLELSELAVFIDKAKLFVGVDSAPMHMAAALKTPSVVLFGPTNRKQWHPWESPHILLWAGDYRELPKEVDTDTDERYLDAIPVEDVKAAVEKCLADSSQACILNNI